MMINDMKKNELTEQEMNGVAGGFGGSDAVRVWEEMERDMQKQEEARKKAEAARQKAIQQAEAANQSGAHAHGSGASGGW